MEIAIKLPADFAVQSVEWDAKTKTLRIVPRFFAATAPLGTVTVTGKAGAEKVSVMQINGNSGMPSFVQPAKEVEATAFDKLKKGGT